MQLMFPSAQGALSAGQGAHLGQGWQQCCISEAGVRSVCELSSQGKAERRRDLAHPVGSGLGSPYFIFANCTLAGLHSTWCVGSLSCTKRPALASSGLSPASRLFDGHLSVIVQRSGEAQPPAREKRTPTSAAAEKAKGGSFPAEIGADEPGTQDSARGSSEPGCTGGPRAPGTRGGSPGPSSPAGPSGACLSIVIRYCRRCGYFAPRYLGFSGAGALPTAASRATCGGGKDRERTTPADLPAGLRSSPPTFCPRVPLSPPPPRSPSRSAASPPGNEIAPHRDPRVSRCHLIGPPNSPAVQPEPGRGTGEGKRKVGRVLGHRGARAALAEAAALARSPRPRPPPRAPGPPLRPRLPPAPGPPGTSPAGGWRDGKGAWPGTSFARAWVLDGDFSRKEWLFDSTRAPMPRALQSYELDFRRLSLDGGRRGVGSWTGRVGQPALVTASFPPYFRNEIRESGSIYGNLGSGPSLSCPLESFQWFLRTLFPGRDDSEKSTAQSYGGPLALRVWPLAWRCPREKCEEASSRPCSPFVPWPVPRQREWRHGPGNLCAYLG
ncbi:uncharacterized protein [Canis lupus baileyi]|uniref:uncharacterized protein n=1 Tax=Canis lupus baileyi TaxID=143281 RepID=UPI003B977EFF